MYRSCLLTLGIAITLFIGVVPTNAGVGEQSPLAGDARMAPQSPERTLQSTSAAVPDRFLPSAFLAGTVAVQVVFVESDGSAEPSTEDWEAPQIATVSAQIRAALDWWAARVPEAHVTFAMTTEIAPSGYEPIGHDLKTEHLWVGDVLGRMGYTGASHFDQAYAADDRWRKAQHTDWATTIFVVNSANDNDGRFADGHFAYAYIGGPFLVVTSDAGMYGTDQLAPVVGHELGHIFGALDQYADAGVPCAMQAGYLAIPTSNSQANNCGSNFICIMLEPLRAYHENAIDESALGQIGYHDTNHNGIPDPIDTTPLLNVTMAALSNGRPSLVAHAADQPARSSTQRAITINTITAIEYRADNGPWTLLAPADGAYDSIEETANATLPLYDGTHTVELRARNRVGAVSPTATQTMTITGVGAAPTYTVAAPSLTSSTAVTITLVAPGGFEARVGATPTFAGATWLPAAAGLTYQLGQEDGDYHYYVQLRDEHGLETALVVAQVLLDREPPTGSAQLHKGPTPTLDVQAQDALSGVAAIQLQGANTIPAWQAFTSKIALPGSAFPQYIRLRDRAGNISIPINIQQSYTVYLPLAAGK